MNGGNGLVLAGVLRVLSFVILLPIPPGVALTVTRSADVALVLSGYGLHAGRTGTGEGRRCNGMLQERPQATRSPTRHKSSTANYIPLLSSILAWELIRRPAKALCADFPKSPSGVPWREAHVAEIWTIKPTQLPDSIDG